MPPRLTASRKAGDRGSNGSEASFKRRRTGRTASTRQAPPSARYRRILEDEAYEAQIQKRWDLLCGFRWWMFANLKSMAAASSPTIQLLAAYHQHRSSQGASLAHTEGTRWRQVCVALLGYHVYTCGRKALLDACSSVQGDLRCSTRQVV